MTWAKAQIFKVCCVYRNCWDLGSTWWIQYKTADVAEEVTNIRMWRTRPGIRDLACTVVRAIEGL